MKVFYEEEEVRAMRASAVKYQNLMLNLLKQRFPRVDGSSHGEYTLMSRPETIKFIAVLKSTHDTMFREMVENAEKGEMYCYDYNKNKEYLEQSEKALTKVVNGEKVEGYSENTLRFRGSDYQPNAESLKAAKSGNMAFIKEIEIFQDLQGVLDWENFSKSSNDAQLPGVHEKKLMDPSIIFFSGMQHMRYGNPLRDESASFWTILKTLARDELIAHMFVPGAVKVMSGNMSSEQRKACHEVVRAALKARIRVMYLSSIGLTDAPSLMSDSCDTERFMLEVQTCNMMLEIFS